MTKPRTDDETGNLADLERLPQQKAAWLVGKPASWLRDNAHLDGRHADGSYHAKNLVRAVRSDYTAAELPDGDLDPVLRAAEDFAYGTAEVPALIQIFEGIRQRYGAAGMAAIAEVFLEKLQAFCQEYNDGSHFRKPLASEIQAKADAEIAKLWEWDARRAMRVVLQCCVCGKYRWGRQWKELPAPKGYLVQDGLECPQCE